MCEIKLLNIFQYLTEEETDLELNKQRMVVEQRLAQQAKDKRQNVKYCSLLVEQSLYIIWSNLDFYVMQSTLRQNKSQGKN